jgi:gluconate 2-dehydrogenase gamma chain
MDRVTRRSFVTAVGAAALAPGARLLASSAGAPAPGGRAGAYAFFDAAEARFIESACARLLPAEAGGNGAFALAACHYVDVQLAGGWGSGEHLYRAGSWQPGSPRRLAKSPAALFRAALRAINQALLHDGRSFATMHGRAQDVFLEDLRCGRIALGVPADEFFALLLQMTAEAFFSNPRSAVHDRIAWPLTAFPGAHAALS